MPSKLIGGCVLVTGGLISGWNLTTILKGRVISQNTVVSIADDCTYKSFAYRNIKRDWI